MSEGVYEDYQGIAIGDPSIRRLDPMRALPGLAIAATSALLGLWVFYVRPNAAPPEIVIAAHQAPAEASPFGALAPSPDLTQPGAATSPDARRFGALAIGQSSSDSSSPFAAPIARFSLSTPYGGLGDLQGSVSWGLIALNPTQAFVSDDAEPGPAPQIATTLVNPPLPPRRPTDLASPPAAAPEASVPPAVATLGPDRPAGPDVPGFFSRLIATVSHPNVGGLAPNAGRTVAYAAPETSSVARNSSRDNAILRSLTPSAPPGALSRYDGYTAVYDIEAKTVYLPNGTRLEAHSGLGDLKDDPKHVNTHARGATPPDVYELTARESLFHGVQALRLKPVGSGEQFGRTGLLAHPYMLGPDGDSFGCVSFKDYDAFLQAFQSGQVKKLVVVAKLD